MRRTSCVAAALALAVVAADAMAAQAAQGQIELAKPLADREVCLHHIGGAEKESRIPKGLLAAIGLTESGRTLKGGERVVWPWTVNAAGEGRFFDSKAEAIAFVEEKRADGVESIDVGCMQINLRHHPDAFASLEDAFDPATNVAYAAQFLTELHGALNGWLPAARRYHSATPERAEVYGERVLANWSGAAQEQELAAAEPAATDAAPVTAGGFLRATPVRVVTGSGTLSLFAQFYTPPPKQGAAAGAGESGPGGPLLAAAPKLITRRVVPGQTGLTLQDYRSQ